MARFEIVERKVIEIDDDYVTQDRIKAALIASSTNDISDGVQNELYEANGNAIIYETVIVNEIAVKRL
jgi:hypothetical protein